MPAAKQNQRRTASRTASRGRSSSSGSGSPSRAAGGSNSRSRAAGGSNSRKGQSRNGTTQRTASNGAGSQSGNGALVRLGVGALGAAVGLAGGVALGRTALQRNRKVLGVAVPSKIDLSGVGQQLGEAGRQFGKLASEVRAVREKAEEIGKVLT
jgi:hypothetical protein